MWRKATRVSSQGPRVQGIPSLDEAVLSSWRNPTLPGSQRGDGGDRAHILQMIAVYLPGATRPGWLCWGGSSRLLCQESQRIHRGGTTRRVIENTPGRDRPCRHSQLVYECIQRRAGVCRIVHIRCAMPPVIHQPRPPARYRRRRHQRRIRRHPRYLDRVQEVLRFCAEPAPMTRLTGRMAAKARAEHGKERLRQTLREAETGGQLDQERPQLRAQGLHVV